MQEKKEEKRNKCPRENKDKETRCNEEKNERSIKPVAQRQYMVSGTLALPIYIAMAVLK